MAIHMFRPIDLFHRGLAGVILLLASVLASAQAPPDWLWITRHSDTMQSAAMHPSGQKFYTCGVDGFTKCWDTATGQVIWQTPSAYATLTLSPDGSLLIVTDHRIRVYDTATNTLLHTRTSTARTSAFSPTENIYAAGLSNGNIQVFDGTTRFLLYTLVPPSSDQHWTGLAFSPDGRYLAIAGYTNGVVIWNLQTRTIDRTISISPAGSLSYSPDGRLLAVGRVGGPISIYSFDTSSTIRQLTHGVNQLEFQSDGTLISAGTGLKRWDVSTGAVLQDQPTSYTITDYSISPTSGRLLAVGYGASVRTYNVSNFALEGTFEEHSRKVLTTDVFDGTVLFGSQDNSIRVWDLLSRQQVSFFSGFGAPIYNARIAPDRSYIAVSAGANVHLLDSTTGLVLHTFSGIWSAYALAISSDGSKLARNDHGRVKVYDVASKSMLFQFDSTETIGCAEFSSDSRYLITAGTTVIPFEARVHDSTSGQLVHTFTGPASLVATSPVEPLVATISGTKLRFHNIVSGQKLAEVTVLLNPMCLAFSADGKTVAVGGDDSSQAGQLLLFDVATGAQLAIVKDLMSLEEIRFSRDDALVSVAGHSYGVFRNPLLFDADPQSLAVTLGRLTSGSVAGLVTPDDNSVAVVSLDTRTRGGNRAQLDVTSALPHAAPRKLKVNVRARSSVSGLQARVQLHDPSLNQWVTVSSGHALGSGYGDIMAEVVSQPTRFIGSGGEVRARFQVYGLATQIKQIGNVTVDWFHFSGSK